MVGRGRPCALDAGQRDDLPAGGDWEATMTSAGLSGSPTGLDAAIAAQHYEVVALRLALGVLRALEDASAGAAAARDELLALLEDDLDDIAGRGHGGREVGR